MTEADRVSNSPSPRPVGLASTDSFRGYQHEDYQFLWDTGRAACWDEAGTGKTRPILAAADGRRLVIAPAAIRDTKVWQRTADFLGIEPPRVISYQQAAKEADDYRLDTLIIDEAHHLKEGKTSWADPIYRLARRTERVYHATGTPTPNDPKEIWGQLRQLWAPTERRSEYYWPWIQEWFAPAPTRYSTYAIGGQLLGCNHYDDDGAQSESCEHWQRFHTANIAGYAIRHLRDDVMPDLPPLDGDKDPVWCPQTAVQLKAYRSMARDFLAHIPEEGVTLEALSSASKFQMLHQMSSGLSVVDPNADPKDRHSGKLAYLREVLTYADKPILTVAWYKNSAAAIARVCQQLKIPYALFGTNTSATQRVKIVDAFGRGKVPVLIASLAVVKEGVDGLQYGSDEVVLFERYWVPGDNEQTIRRLHRFGQTRPVTARQLVTPASVDEHQWETVKVKRVNIQRVLSPVEIAYMLGVQPPARAVTLVEQPGDLA